MFDLPKPKKNIDLDFRCLACAHEFRRKPRRVYVDMPTFKREHVEKKPTHRSAFVVAQRIICPKCGAVDEYELHAMSQTHLQMTILVGAIAGSLAPGHPVKPINFTLADGTPMHPLDALELYAGRVAQQPDNVAIRVRYANTLRTLGYLDEAAAQYQEALDRDAQTLEAWINLAAIHSAARRRGAARKALQSLVVHAAGSRHPQRDEWAGYAQALLDGVAALDELTPESLLGDAPEEKRTAQRKRLLKRKPKKKKRGKK